MSGYSRTGSRENAITPNRMIERLITVAKTGRWMDTSLSFMERLLASLSGASALSSRPSPDRNHLRALEELLVARAHHRHPGLEALHHLHRVGEARAERERAAGDRAVLLHDVGERLISLGEDGFAGDRERVRALAQHRRDVGRHAGPEFSARIPYPRDDPRAPGARVEHRIHHVDAALQRVAGVGRCRDLDLGALPELPRSEEHTSELQS